MYTLMSNQGINGRRNKLINTASELYGIDIGLQPITDVAKNVNINQTQGQNRLAIALANMEKCVKHNIIVIKK